MMQESCRFANLNLLLLSCRSRSRRRRRCFWSQLSRHKKLKIKTVRYKSRIWERKGGNYTEALAEFQVSAVFNTRDHIRRNDLPIFIELCMKTPSWYESGLALWAPTYAGRY